MHGRSNVAVISQFEQVVRHSGLCKFHSCALVAKCYTRDKMRGKQYPRAPKNPNRGVNFFFNTVHLLPNNFRFEHGAPNLFLAPGAI